MDPALIPPVSIISPVDSMVLLNCPRMIVKSGSSSLPMRSTESPPGGAPHSPVTVTPGASPEGPGHSPAGTARRGAGRHWALGTGHRARGAGRRALGGAQVVQAGRSARACHTLGSVTRSHGSQHAAHTRGGEVRARRRRGHGAAPRRARIRTRKTLRSGGGGEGRGGCT